MSIRNPRLPLIPGYSLNTLIGKKSHGVRPIFTAIDGVRMLIDKADKLSQVPSLYTRKSTTDQPTWIIYDKQILRFDAYFQQSLHEMRDPAIIRKVNIFFFLEDGTIKVVEPKTENSGLLQGILISRQRIRLPFSYDMYYDVLDLNIDREVVFHGKVFKIIDCDNFTRVFLNRLGIHVPDRVLLPSYAAPPPPKPCSKPKKFPMKQFLDFDRQVLSFSGYWDDRETTFGYIHFLEIHYFLSDDQMEIKEVMPPGSNMAAGPMFLKKGVLPRRVPKKIEMTGGPPVPTYTPADLTIGAVLNVYGRKVVITDCDPFTKEYYRVKYGIDNFAPLPNPHEESADCISKSINERELPPWNGYGSYEDSAGNCRTVLPKPPHRDFIKFLYKDRVGFDSHVIRFGARMISDIKDNDIRYFIISYYLSDDTIGIFELAERNSGFKGGRFLRRDIAYLPGYDMFVSQPPPTYKASDFKLGAELVVNDHTFRLISADEYALRYMELNPQEFPQSNVARILDRIRSKLMSVENGYKNFVSKHMNAVVNSDVMAASCFKAALEELLEGNIGEHEMVTLLRHFRGDIGAKARPRRQMIRSLVFTTLNRGLWDDRERLLEELLHADEDQREVLSRHRLRQILRACRLPMPDHLMDCMLDVLERDDQCNIRYKDLMNFLDFKTCPATSWSEDELRKLVRHAPPLKDTECQEWETLDRIVAEGYINWSAFLCQLNLEHTINESKPA